MIKMLVDDTMKEQDRTVSIRIDPDGAISINIYPLIDDGARKQMTEQELEERITEQMDRERVREAILTLEIENLKKAVEQIENVSGLSGV